MDAQDLGYLVASILLVTLIPALIGGLLRRARPPSSVAVGIASAIAIFLCIAGIAGGEPWAYLIAIALYAVLVLLRYVQWSKRHGTSDASGIAAPALDRRGLNGWQRMFSVVAVLVVLPAFAAWVVSKPSDLNAKRYVYGCYEVLTSTDVTPREAQAALDQRYIAIPEGCAESLRGVATGRTHAEEQQNWIRSLWAGSVWIIGLLAVMYAFGWSVGWIWRGFFPKRSGP